MSYSRRSKNSQTERNLEIFNLREDGKTFREIGEKFNISKTRASQIHFSEKKRKMYEDIKKLKDKR